MHDDNLSEISADAIQRPVSFQIPVETLQVTAFSSPRSQTFFTKVRARLRLWHIWITRCSVVNIVYFSLSEVELPPTIFVNFHKWQAMSHCLVPKLPLSIRVKTVSTPSTRQNFFPFTSVHVYSCFGLLGFWAEGNRSIVWPVIGPFKTKNIVAGATLDFPAGAEDENLAILLEGQKRR